MKRLADFKPLESAKRGDIWDFMQGVGRYLASK
jgi:hypothetical protein